MKVAAVDFETTYDKECSIKPLGWDAYFRHPNFEAYLVAIKTNDGLEWVGHPLEAPWGKIKDHEWLSHNAAFDENLYYVAKDLGWWGDIPLPPAWHCTSDMVSYLGYPRSLKDSCKSILGADLSKEVRENMMGLRPPNSFPCVNTGAKDNWEPMDDKFWQDVLDYALDNSVWCLKLWETCHKMWPDYEQWLSSHTRRMSRRGIPIDIDYVNECKNKLKQTVFDFENQIPWQGEAKLLSRAAFDRECAKHGLKPPKSLDQNNAEASIWFEVNEPKYAWIHAYRNWRRANSLLSRVEATLRATRKCGDHYRFFGGLLYCGAHTRRWSGSGGNTSLHNMAKGEMFGVQLRRFFRAPDGKKLMAIDLSQIEVRTLTWLAGDTEMLERIRQSPDIYQAYGEGFGLWDAARGVLKELNNDLRQRIKPIVLGSGFGASAFAFANKEYAELLKMVEDKYPTIDERESVARDYLGSKLNNPETVGPWWWRKMGRYLDKSAMSIVIKLTASGKEFETTEPSWKKWEKDFIKHERKLSRGARTPLKIDDWKWDWTAVVIHKESEACVQMYRDSMKAVVSFWGRLKDTITKSVFDKRMSFKFPSGNSLVYRNLRRTSVTDSDTKKRSSQVFAIKAKPGGWGLMKLWYGLIVENLAQSLARDIFAHFFKPLEEAGIPILFHTHDEVVAEVPAEQANALLDKGVTIMKNPPEWILNIPLDAEGDIGDTYADCK